MASSSSEVENIVVNSGPWKTRKQNERKTYREDSDEDIDDDYNCIQLLKLTDELENDRYSHNFVVEMNGKDLNISFFQDKKFTVPLLFQNKNGLGLTVPHTTFSVKEICRLVGPRRNIDVMDVKTQNNFTMCLKEWIKYYEDPKKDKILNVISLEFSHTKLEERVESPSVVRELDWVDCVWPTNLKMRQIESTNNVDRMKYPKVQKYCLMSVKGSYTDFHIDFGGTSVWYHILRGKKVFFLIPPTGQNFKLYEKWVLSGKQNDVFFGSKVELCGRVQLETGNTFFIPSGWIHAVYTTEDTVAFGGNFLHMFAVQTQLRVADIEETTRVSQKFKYPLFVEMLWYVLEHYVYCFTRVSFIEEGAKYRPHPEKTYTFFTDEEYLGLVAIIKYLSGLPLHKQNVPSSIKKAAQLIKDIGFILKKHSNNAKSEDNDTDNALNIITRKKVTTKTPGTTRSIPNKRRIRRIRCKNCDACKKADCRKCAFCIDMVKYGGPGRCKQTCIQRQCLKPMFRTTAVCEICSLDGWGQDINNKITTYDDTPSKLMECSVCLEIVHPECLFKESAYDNNGSLHDDLPNSWDCPKCCENGISSEGNSRFFRARNELLRIRDSKFIVNVNEHQNQLENDMASGSNKRQKVTRKESVSSSCSSVDTGLVLTDWWDPGAGELVDAFFPSLDSTSF